MQHIYIYIYIYVYSTQIYTQRTYIQQIFFGGRQCCFIHLVLCMRQASIALRKQKGMAISTIVLSTRMCKLCCNHISCLMCGTETMVCGENKSYVHTRPVCGTCKSSKVWASKRLRAGVDTMARIWGGHGDWQIENTQMRVVRSDAYDSSVQVGIVPNHLTGCTVQLIVFVHKWIIRT